MNSKKSLFAIVIGDDRLLAVFTRKDALAVVYRLFYVSRPVLSAVACDVLNHVTFRKGEAVRFNVCYWLDREPIVFLRCHVTLLRC